MCRLSVRIQLACGERSFDELHLQHGLYWTGWWHMHRLYCRNVQGIDRISCVHELRGRDLFYSSKGRIKFDMSCLSVSLHLVGGEPSFDELHLQRGLNWVGWWHMHSVCCRKVQDIDRSSCAQTAGQGRILQQGGPSRKTLAPIVRQAHISRPWGTMSCPIASIVWWVSTQA